MDPLALLDIPQESESELPDTKEKKKKKLSPAALKKLQQKAAEEARQHLIKQKQLFLAETKKRVQLEWEANHAREEVYGAEFESRRELLLRSSQRLSEVEKVCREWREQRREQQEWLQYLTCDRLPNPSSVSQMNSYIFVWTELDKNDQMSHCIRKTEEVMELLSGLEAIIKDPGPNRPPRFLRDMKELRTEIRDLLQAHIDRATFYLFSRIDTDMVPINVTTSKYFAKSQYFLMSFWAELITPIPSSKKKETRNPLKVTFDETEVTVTVPVSLLGLRKVMRVVWLSYDHWSDKCRTFECPPVPAYYNQNLFDLFMTEHEMKLEIMHYRNQLEILTKKKISGIPPEPTLSQEILAWESEPQRSLSEEIVYRECTEEESMGNQIKTILNEFEVNLRERTFLGPLLLLEIFRQPPQPKVLRYKHSVTLRREPPLLHPVDYYVQYPPPEEPPLPEGEPAEERDWRKPGHETQKVDLAEEKKKLVVVQLKMNPAVVWFEQPQVANWDPVHGYWSTEDIHDTTFDEEDGTMTFKTGRLGLMGLHVSRYCCLPYLDWLLEPNEEGGVNFFLKTSFPELHFRIKEGKVCLEFMKEMPSRTLNWILGNYYPPLELLELLQKGGLNVFPDPDAAFYIPNIESKHAVVERNIYQVWGVFCRSFRFKRARFNQDAGRGNAVFQTHEISKNNQVDYCLVQTTMCSSFVLDVSEESEQYSAEPAPGMSSCVDLYSLLESNSTAEARRAADATCYLLIQTITEFLSCVRPLSFS